MSVIYNRAEFGLFNNGTFERGTNEFFTASSGTAYSGDAYQGGYSLKITGQPQWQGSQYVAVDTSKYYTFSIVAKTIQRSSPSNSLGQFYSGFACYDRSYNFVDSRTQGGLGNTTLSRALNPGDASAYITSSTNWDTSATFDFRRLLIYPATHPLYSAPYKYTRIGYGDFSIIYAQTITLMPEGDYRLDLVDSAGTPVTMPNIGYPTPIGTPVSNGRSAGTYNYVFVTSIPETWTKYQTAPFTGEDRTSALPFRYGTKFIKYMELSNYTLTAETTKPTYLIDNLILAESPTNRVFTLP